MIQNPGCTDVCRIPLNSAETFPLLLAAAGRLPLLVTGVAGVSGFNALAFFRQRYGEQVLGQRPKKNWRLRGPGIVGLDLEDSEAIRRTIVEGGFRTVLNCGGSCALKSCELDEQMAVRVNVECVRSLLQAMHLLPIRFVHLSIDLVFSGTRGGRHVESDATDPVTVYGKTMVDAENLIRAERPDACIGRISLPMGMSFNGHAGAIDWIQSRFAKQRPATLYYDEIRTPTYVDCLSEVCEELLASDVNGLVHLGGPRLLTLNEIAQVVNRVGGYDPNLLRGCNRIEAGPIPPRAGNVSMDSSRLLQTFGREAFAPWPYFEELVPTHRNWHFERDGFVGSPDLIAKLLYQRPRIGDSLANMIGNR